MQCPLPQVLGITSSLLKMQMPENDKSSPSFNRNLKNVIWGEVTGSAIALASVFMARKVLPEQTEQLTSRLSDILQRRSAKTPEESHMTTERVIDVVLMNVGGLASVLTQFAMRRMGKNEHKYSLPVDLAALLVGRIGGTSTMAAGLYATEKMAGTPLRTSEDMVAKGIHWLNGKASGKENVPLSEMEQRAAYVAVSNILQSLFAIPGNAMAQTFTDKVMAGKGQDARGR